MFNLWDVVGSPLVVCSRSTGLKFKLFCLANTYLFKVTKFLLSCATSMDSFMPRHFKIAGRQLS